MNASQGIAALVSFGQVQRAFYEVIKRKQELFLDPTLVSAYPDQLIVELNRVWDLIDSTYGLEQAAIDAARSAADRAMFDFALSFETMGDSGLDQPGTPVLAINAPTAQILVERGYWSDTDFAAFERFRQAAANVATLHNACEAWVVDFANFSRQNPSAPAPTWDWLIQRNPVPSTSGLGSGLPGWVWVVLGFLAFAFGA